MNRNLVLFLGSSVGIIIGILILYLIPIDKPIYKVGVCFRNKERPKVIKIVDITKDSYEINIYSFNSIANFFHFKKLLIEFKKFNEKIKEDYFKMEDCNSEKILKKYES